MASAIITALGRPKTKPFSFKFESINSTKRPKPSTMIGTASVINLGPLLKAKKPSASMPSETVNDRPKTKPFSFKFASTNSTK